jgi:hypothetical protein
MKLQRRLLTKWSLSFQTSFIFTSVYFLPHYWVYAAKRALKRKLYNVDHSIILATGKGRVANGQSEFIFMK